MSYGTEHIFAIFVCFVIVTIVIVAAWCMREVRRNLRERPEGRHTRAAFAQPDAAADRFGHVTQAWLRDLHEAELPVAGCLPVSPPDETRPQAAIKDPAVCELGMPAEEYLDGLFGKAAAAIGELS